MEKEEIKEEKKTNKLTPILVIILLLAILAGAVYYFYEKIIKKPETLFESASAMQIVKVNESAEDKDADDEESAVIPSGIVNILLVGVDVKGDGSTTSGTVPHADMVMVAAINFDENKVDLISIPRDSFTVAIEPHKGYYKMNGIFNVGGGMENPEEAIDYVRQVSEQWLGGISIPYYYGLSFQAFIDIVDAIGGIDYETDIPFTSFDGKYYPSGFHHLDGNAAARYMETRLNVADGRDFSRTDRQRRFLIAIFKKLKDEAKLTQLPSLINSASSNIWTNTSMAQTAALANYAKDFDSANIDTHTWSGLYMINYTWAYDFIDQEKRIDIIKDVYGIEVEPVRTNSRRYEEFIHFYGATNIKYLSQCEKLLEYADESTEGYKECEEAYIELQNAHDKLDNWFKDNYLGEFGYYSIDENAEKNELVSPLRSLRNTLEQTAKKLAENSEYPYELTFCEVTDYWNDSDINDVVFDYA